MRDTEVFRRDAEHRKDKIRDKTRERLRDREAFRQSMLKTDSTE